MGTGKVPRSAILNSLLLLTVAFAHPAGAQVPHRVTLQGAVHVNSQPFSGIGQFKFALVDPTGTVTFWSHDGSSHRGLEPVSAIALPVSEGAYTVVLGDTQLPNMSELPPTVFANSNVHARVWFSDGVQPFQHLPPDEALIPSAYAMMSAQVAAGAVGSTQLAEGAVTASKLAPGAVTPSALADGAVLSNLGKSGGLVVSTSPTNAALLASGFRKIGSTTVEGENWRSIDRQSPPPRSAHRAFWSGTEMLVVGGNPVATPANTALTALPGLRFDPRLGTWLPLPTNNAPLLPRSAATSIGDTDDWRIEWSGSEILAWNLRSRTGARCYPRGTEWRRLSTANTPSPRTAAFTVLTPRGWFVWGGWPTTGSGGPRPDGSMYLLDEDTWTSIPTNGAPSPRGSGIALWTGTQVLVIGGQGLGSGDTAVLLNDTWSYDPTTATWNRLHSGTGQSLGYLDPRLALWTGKEALLFASSSTSGGLKFDPEERRWTALAPMPGIFSALTGASAVWTGKEALIWGGYASGELSRRGFAYDPTRDVWREFSTAEAPTPRRIHSAVWTGTQMMVWGGNDSTGFPNVGTDLSDGGIYRPTDNRWLAIEFPKVQRNFATAVWTGEEILVWGGSSSSVPQSSTYSLGGGYRLNPKTGHTRPLSTVNAPTPRAGACAVWTGTQLIVWGGYEATVESQNRQRAGTGSRYDPVLDQWSSINTDGAPSIRGQASAVWTGTEMIVWGGNSLNGGTGIFNTGGRYSPANNQWRPMSTTLGALPLSPRIGHCAVWTGREMLVWGGGTNALRYLPTADAWSAISLKDAPASSTLSYAPNPTAIWTDNGMLAWGGKWGLYDPSTDTWRVIAQATAPTWNANLPMVWTGSEVLAWNGTTSGAHRYDPVANVWNRMTPTDAPSARNGHAVVWTGDTAIVVGGYVTGSRSESLTFSMPIYSRTRPLYIYGGISMP
ncbi:MAG: hypothetical protein JNK85_01550 [Verrucomicrobiales bacterium]|nr:hypothetical protein [Verrucomicrobiales bacterium]